MLKFPFRHEERHSALKKLGITAYSSQNPFPSRNRFYPAIFVAFDLETPIYYAKSTFGRDCYFHVEDGALPAPDGPLTRMDLEGSIMMSSLLALQIFVSCGKR